MDNVRPKCSVTVMPICGGRIGFIRRGSKDSYANQLLAPGGKVEVGDGELMDGAPYWSVEEAAVREMKEETGIDITRGQLKYFCSLTLPDGRVVISMYCELSNNIVGGSPLLLLSHQDVKRCKSEDFAPGMREEALLLFQLLGR